MLVSWTFFVCVPVYVHTGPEATPKTDTLTTVDRHGIDASIIACTSCPPREPSVCRYDTSFERDFSMLGELLVSNDVTIFISLRRAW